MAPNERTDSRPALLGETVEDSQDGARMSFLEHLEELRRRILYSVYSLIGACILPGIYADRIYKWMLAYFHQVLPPTVKLIYTQASDGFMFEVKLVLLVGVLIASPFIFAQLWLFIAPGLYAKEKKVVIPFVVCASTLFLAGAAFSHFYIFLMMWRFFETFSNEYIQFVPTIGDAFELYVQLMLAMGAVCQMPILVFFLTRFGIITWRFLVNQWKYAILIITVVAAVVTPTPDVPTMLAVAAPMFVLYGVSIGVAWFFRRRETAQV
jgi:sec-independent protein translocase protein TatC